ncbi:alpha/beta fold hydrolase [Cocleimonas sp. KMM 6892]|uniref:alpha/beta fold hydrolase n=1 Tax=unclassified Cocleimonas TaxID=2639732 RepID=UPI002DB94596|nr:MULTISPECIES: alpha/beta fold hydrolase [unclassified Cocleimonas]MEB8433770.1 alpha/beta fold hydrolase [Cocleimonas sp. KMM 6892]MEC4716581.1 alpha/beta fold hydrolase [Cocleimonas sp. KMM 6895]MEC4746264.1 alpha/beta fold hydrolase [Cocleimonas sp. KMM 6896]
MKKLLVKSSGFGSSSDYRPTLLLLHGWGMNSNVWKPVLPGLESHYQIHLVDLPGHGINNDVNADSMQDIVALFSDLIDELDQEKVHIMGWSLGGLIAQALADKIPEKIQSLTLVASTLRFSQDESAESLWPHAMSLKVLNNFAINLHKDIEGTLKRFIALQFMGVAGSKEIQRELIQDICPAEDKAASSEKVPKSGGVTNRVKIGVKSGVTSDSLTLGLKLLAESDFRNSVSHHPQLWLFAGKDRLIPADVINDLKSLRSDAQITLLENAGHAPFMTHPDEFVSAVSTFIDTSK